MPFYEYQCSSCHEQTEVMQKISDAPLKKCPACGKNTLKKLISAPVFRLKGGGWYETDFKSDGEKKRNLVDDGGKEESKSDTSSNEAKSSATPSKTETATKPEKKPAAKPSARATKPVRKSAGAKKAKRKSR